MLPGFPEFFPFFRRGRSGGHPGSVSDAQASSIRFPSVKVTTDRTAYRPGDAILATIEVFNDNRLESVPGADSSGALLIENLVVEVKGLEKLDPQWLITPMPIRGSKQRRGERTIVESSPIAFVSDVVLKHGAKKTYSIRTILPKVLPPSYKGTVVRYLYYLVVNLHWSPIVIENGHSRSSSDKASFTPLEVRTNLNIWAMPNNSGLTSEEFQSKEYWGIVPKSPVQVEIFWKEKDDDTDWTRAADVLFGEDDCASQGAESSLHSPVKGGLSMSFDRILQLQSPAVSPRGSVKESLFHRSEISRIAPSKKATLLAASTFETAFDPLEGSKKTIFKNYSDGILSERTGFGGKVAVESRSMDNYELLSGESASESSANCNGEYDLGMNLPWSSSGGYVRGKSYNIRFDDQILARFSPKNSDSTYYFGDVVGGVLSFCHDEGSRRCLEFSAILETREVLNAAFIHPSRKNSPIITKVQSDYHEVVVDMLQTHFVFSIPLDGPPSFTTPQVSVQWILRLEFIATPYNVDCSKYDHPLLIEGRERGEWSVPLVVHAPLPKTQTAVMRRDRPPSPRRDFWSGSLISAERRITPLVLPPTSESVWDDREDGPSSSHRWQ
eukprot:c27737_g1_i1 orf=439-2274(-)